MRTSLPRGLEGLLRWTLPSDLVEPVAGDLLQEFSERAGRNGTAPAAAAVWWQGSRLAWMFTIERLLGRRGLPPIGDELPRRARMLEALAQDVAFGARLLKRQPGFTASAVFVLALGIGGVTTIFSVADNVLWQPLPYPAADALVAIGEQRPREQRDFGSVSAPDFNDWGRDATTLTSIAAHLDTRVDLTGQGEPERVQATQVSSAFFKTLDVQPVQGRDFEARDDQPGHARVVLLTDGFWRRRFAADPDIVGKTIAIDREPHAVIGILPRGFWWRSRADVFLPLEVPASIRGCEGRTYCKCWDGGATVSAWNRPVLTSTASAASSNSSSPRPTMGICRGCCRSASRSSDRCSPRWCCCSRRLPLCC